MGTVSYKSHLFNYIQNYIKYAADKYTKFLTFDVARTSSSIFTFNKIGK